eukprot:5780064-Pleurochrysis_carterae.AAC.2
MFQRMASCRRFQSAPSLQRVPHDCVRLPRACTGERGRPDDRSMPPGQEGGHGLLCQGDVAKTVRR